MDTTGNNTVYVAAIDADVLVVPISERNLRRIRSGGIDFQEMDVQKLTHGIPCLTEEDARAITLRFTSGALRPVLDEIDRLSETGEHLSTPPSSMHKVIAPSVEATAWLSRFNCDRGCGTDLSPGTSTRGPLRRLCHKGDNRLCWQERVREDKELSRARARSAVPRAYARFDPVGGRSIPVREAIPISGFGVGYEDSGYWEKTNREERAATELLNGHASVDPATLNVTQVNQKWRDQQDLDRRRGPVLTFPWKSNR